MIRLKELESVSSVLTVCGAVVLSDLPGNIFPSHRVPDAGWMAGLYIEAAEGFVLEGVRIEFRNHHHQDYWGSMRQPESGWVSCNP